MKERVAILGAGAMGSAIARGLLQAQTIPPQNLILYDIAWEYVQQLAQQLGVSLANSNSEAVQRAEVVLLAVKPQVLPEVLEEIAPEIQPDRHLVISIAAGIPLATLQGHLPAGTPVVRVMPNILAQVRSAISVYVPGDRVKEEHRRVVEEIFKAVGLVELGEERYMDAITGLSGSGPAYVFMMIEALADGGVKMGLPRALALKLSAQTVLGSAKMVLETGEHPAALKDKVTSPGGTTIAGIAELEQGAFRSVLIRAVESATLRSQELSGK